MYGERKYLGAVFSLRNASTVPNPFAPIIRPFTAQGEAITLSYLISESITAMYCAGVPGLPTS